VSLGLEITVVFAVFLGLLAVGMAIPFAIGVPALLYLLLHGGLPAIRGLGLVSWGSMDSFTLTAIPLFILMAEIMQHSGLSFRIYRGLSRIVSRIPGGLLQTNIAGCAIFAAISGSSVATAASIGSVALPQLIRRNYSRQLSAGSLAAGGTLGILFPPSLAMIVYGSFRQSWRATLGLFPRRSFVRCDGQSLPRRYPLWPDLSRLAGRRLDACRGVRGLAKRAQNPSRRADPHR
jgi:C4-dicarboxylate transporter, DctM subunit